MKWFINLVLKCGNLKLLTAYCKKRHIVKKPCNLLLVLLYETALFHWKQPENKSLLFLPIYDSGSCDLTELYFSSCLTIFPRARMGSESIAYEAAKKPAFFATSGP